MFAAWAVKCTSAVQTRYKQVTVEFNHLKPDLHGTTRKQILERARVDLEHTTCCILQKAHDKPHFCGTAQT